MTGGNSLNFAVLESTATDATELTIKWLKLLEILASYRSVVVAFSGGVDSGLLSVAAYKALGEKMLAVTARSPVNNPDDVAAAQSVVRQVGFSHLFVDYDDLTNPNFVANPPDRCYHCKMARLKAIQEIARQKGFEQVLEGSNADDSQDYRPGSRAVAELGVYSPLKEVGLRKEEIRSLAHKLGLVVWNRPSAPCLATRFPYGTVITLENLQKVASGENFLHQAGFEQVRVRYAEHSARLEVPAEDISRLVAKREEIVKYFKKLGFTYVLADLAGYRSGSMNEVLKK